jgi:hypothetical protein
MTVAAVHISLRAVYSPEDQLGAARIYRLSRARDLLHAPLPRLLLAVIRSTGNPPRLGRSVPQARALQMIEEAHSDQQIVEEHRTHKLLPRLFPYASACSGAVCNITHCRGDLAVVGILKLPSEL